MDELLPRVAIAPETVASVMTDWGGTENGETQGSPRASRIAVAPQTWLEVGFGGGEHLAWQAAQNPDALMIGAEPFINGAAKLLSAIEDQNLQNVRIRHGDARDLMAAIPDASIDRAFVLHPDPWPKRKHWKRRIVSVPFLTQMHRLLKPGAELRVASDIPDYVRWTLVMRNLAEAAGARFDWTATRASDWTECPDDWPQTRYEAKAIREGRTPTYLSFRRL